MRQCFIVQSTQFDAVSSSCHRSAGFGRARESGERDRTRVMVSQGTKRGRYRPPERRGIPSLARNSAGSLRAGGRRASRHVAGAHPAGVRVKARVWAALDRAIATAGVDCEALNDGVTIEVKHRRLPRRRAWSRAALAVFLSILTKPDTVAPVAPGCKDDAVGRKNGRRPPPRAAEVIHRRRQRSLIQSMARCAPLHQTDADATQLGCVGVL